MENKFLLLMLLFTAWLSACSTGPMHQDHHGPHAHHMHTETHKEWWHIHKVKSHSDHHHLHHKIVQHEDTISIEDEFAVQPFLLDTENLRSVKMMFGDTAEVEITEPEKWEDFEEEIVVIARGSSEIEAFNNNHRNDQIIISASIADSFPIFKKNIVIGMSKEDLMKVFKTIKKQELRADNFEIYCRKKENYIYLIFDHDRLSQIVYWPYTG